MAHSNELAAREHEQNGPNDQPSIVYLLKPNGSTNDTMDLQKLLAPLWRWRWVEMLVLLCTVLVAGWYYIKPGGELRYEIVVDRGDYSGSVGDRRSYLDVRDHLNRVLIPSAAAATAPDWSPDITLLDQRAERLAEIKKLSIEEEQQLKLEPELFTLSFTLSSGTEEDHTALATELTERLQDYAARDGSIVATSMDIAEQKLEQDLAAKQRGLTAKQRSLANLGQRVVGAKRALADKETALRIISEASYVAALRGAVNTQLNRTQLTIDRQMLVVSQLTAREEAIGGRITQLQAVLTDLIAAQDAPNTTASGTARLLADRIATGRLELEQRIPVERLEIARQMIDTQSTIQQLQATLAQEELEIVNFDSDLAIRQAHAQDAITIAMEHITACQQAVEGATEDLDLSRESIVNAEIAIELFKQRTQAKVIHQPLAIIEQFTRIIPNSKKAMMTIAILIIGGLCAVGSAYGLETLRLARLGTLAS